MPARPSPLVVALAANDAYAQGAAVTVRSMLEEHDHSRPVEVYVADAGLSPGNRRRLEQSWADYAPKVSFVRLPAALTRPLMIPEFRPDRARNLTRPNYSPAMYLRLFADRLLPSSLERVLWLDADLHFRRNVAPLWDESLDGKVAAAVQSSRMPWFSSTPALYTFYDLGFPIEQPYMNVGVMLVDLRRFRSERVSQRCTEWVVKNRERLFSCDQDALNAVLADAWRPLDHRWNVEYLADPRDCVLHFQGGPKPWEKDCKHPALAGFQAALDRTAFSGERLRGRGAPKRPSAKKR